MSVDVDVCTATVGGLLTSRCVAVGLVLRRIPLCYRTDLPRLSSSRPFCMGHWRHVSVSITACGRWQLLFAVRNSVGLTSLLCFPLPDAVVPSATVTGFKLKLKSLFIGLMFSLLTLLCNLGRGTYQSRSPALVSRSTHFPFSYFLHTY